MTDNDHGPTDELGGHPDWIELYNTGSATVSLAGLTIADADDEEHPLDPSLEIAPGGHLILWADGKVEQGPAHVPLRLSRDGDTVTLGQGDLVLDRVTFGPLLADVSLARSPDGGAEWEVRASPTPGAANGGAPGEGPPAEGTCGPVAAVTEPHLLEGDTLEITLTCTTGALSEVGIAVGPGDWDDAAGALIWTTGLADGGTYEVLFEVEPEGTVGMPETAVATAWVADRWDDPANVLVDPLTYPEEWGLPVLHLDPSGELTEEYTPVEATFDGVVYQGRMKIRGAASVGYPKNSYTLEFEPIQLPLGDVGLQNKDHLVLVTTFDDNSYVRQKLVYDTWAAMAAWAGEARLAPRTFFVVVHLDGRYHGLYVGIDHIDDEFVREMGFDDQGHLFKSVSHDANFYYWNAAGLRKTSLHDGWEKKEGLPVDDFATLDALTDWSAASSDDTFAAEIDDWIDRTTFMDWFLLVHHLAANDSGGKNAYLYHDPVQLRFLAAPWDFNDALGQTWQTARSPADATNDFVWNNGIFGHFQLESGLAAELWGRYGDQRQLGGPLDVDTLLASIDSYYAAMDDSAARDWARWQREYRDYDGWSWRDDFTTYEEEKAYLTDWVTDRDAWMWTLHP